MKIVPICLAAVALAAGILTGCSQNKAGNEESQTSALVTTDTAEEETGWPRTIIDATGNEVELKERPQRIAVLHSMYLEYFFALETPPAASAGSSVGTAMDALSEWETLKPYEGSAEIQDLGSSRELNLEAILAAEPDVIVTFKGQGGLEAVYDQLVKIAPVIQLDYGLSWQEQTRDCAEIVGKEKEAEELITEIEGIIAQSREKILLHNDKTVALFRTNGGKSFVTRGDRAYYDTFGLTMPEGYPDTYETLSLEAVVQMNPDYIIFQDFRSASEALVKAQEESTIWNTLTAVKGGNIEYFDDSLNTFGPLSMRLTAESLVKVLEGS